ncbi:MAG: ABC transporter substrate-binding protein [Alphaproteobacteria bacterium]|nr:ABC transporter substrate-binding protein [Alphaproteobacteria bacterium]
MTSVRVSAVFRRRILAMAVLLLLPLALGAGSAAAATTSPTGARKFLDDYTKLGLTTFNDKSLDAAAKKQKIRGMIGDGFDIETIARFVLSRHYRSLSDTQRAEYHQLYFDYVLSTYFKRLIDFGKLNLMLIDTTSAQDGDALVNTKADRPDGPPLRLQWRVRANDAGSFKIVDIIAEGVSIAVTQRSDFNAVMSSKGYPGLVDALKQKIRDAEK